MYENQKSPDPQRISWSCYPFIILISLYFEAELLLVFQKFYIISKFFNNPHSEAYLLKQEVSHFTSSMQLIWSDKQNSPHELHSLESCIT